MIRKLSQALSWLEYHGFIKLMDQQKTANKARQTQSLKRYWIPPDFTEKIYDVIRMYRK
jgi:hypothetical protein